MDIVYIFRDEKIRDDIMGVKQVRIFDQVMLKHLRSFHLRSFRFSHGKIMAVLRKVSIRVVLM